MLYIYHKLKSGINLFLFAKSLNLRHGYLQHHHQVPRIPKDRTSGSYEPDTRGACRSRRHPCWAPGYRGLPRRSRQRTSSCVLPARTVSSRTRRSRCCNAARTATGPGRRGPATVSRPQVPVARIRSAHPRRTGNRMRFCSNAPPARSDTGSHSHRPVPWKGTHSARRETGIDLPPSAMVLQK